MELTLETIRAAHARIAPYIVQTPLLRLPALDDALGCEVYAKAECMQRTGAFKLRGAMNKILALTEDERARGFVAASSGNHGRAVAYAAQRTVGLEILEQCPALDALVVPVSGGGLIGGVATAVKALAPHVRVYGAEPEALPRYRESLRAGHPVQVEQQRSVADALVAQKPGDVCFAYVAENTDGFASVADADLLRAMKLLLLEGKLLCEPSSAIGMGAALRGQLPLRRTAKVCFVISGGSVALEQLHRLEDVRL